MINRKSLVGILAIALSSAAWAGIPPTTQVQYLSGHGCDDMVQWDFKCSGGNNSGKWTKIGVPSCWECQGFGTFQYGMKFYGKAFPEGIADEKGEYKYEFNLPSEWNGKEVYLVFEAAMTDCKAQINGRKAVGLHQGGFYRFTADVTDRVFFGSKKNVLTVQVSKESENAGVNLSERRADYWNFGGLIRPVFMVARPALNIHQISIDAKADGHFTAICELNRALEGAKIRTEIFDMNGKKVGSNESAVRGGSDRCDVDFSVKGISQWSAEKPVRYEARFTLIDKNGKELHLEKEKFGFRTIEVRANDGLYINGMKMKVRGVNRHSFRPESGRTLSKAKNIEDVVLIKSMNMNAVRLSHYPADPEFLDACDSLGLYVMSELTGWHGHHETAVGKILVKEMVTRDVNHPSVIWWSNGNEKGWNDELNGEFHLYDPQKRPVIHPQGNFGGFETMHYRSYGETQNYLRKPEIFMPTEFLHGLYDGGHGAGLDDYWKMMYKHPRCAGGFLWALVDEGVKRVDMNGFIDNVGSYGCDGLVGPHYEQEGSYYTVKEIWCPVQIAVENGIINIENRYDFTNLNECKFKWQWVKFAAQNGKAKNGEFTVVKGGELKGPDVAPHSSGSLKLPVDKCDGAEALYITASDQYGNELFTWSYPVKNQPWIAGKSGAKAQTSEADTVLTVKASDAEYSFSKNNGYLLGVKAGGKSFSFSNGPRAVVVRREDRSMDQCYNHDDKDAKQKERLYELFPEAAQFVGFQKEESGDSLVVTAQYRLGNIDKARWAFAPDGSVNLQYTYNFSGVVDMMGIAFDYPETKVKSKSWVGSGPYRVYQNRIKGTKYGFWQNDYNDPIPGESFTYPEFKGYFDNVDWMNIETAEGTICLKNNTPNVYIGVYQPRDGRDRQLWTFPETGISVLNVIAPARNKVNSTDLCGPQSQAKWVDGPVNGNITLKFK